MKPLQFLLSLTMLFCCCTAYAEELVIKHVGPESETDYRHYYYIDLLKLVLGKTQATDGAFRLEMSDRTMLQGRAMVSLQRSDTIDIVWTMTSEEREQELLPIRIPLLKGLLGYRIFIINEQDRATFAAIDTIEELKRLRAGQGHDWPDTAILKANGFKVETSASYEGLFEMLERGRFDYFPRGANEPWFEIEVYADKGFMVEETLALHYAAPIYFFVKKDNVAFAHRIERGLRLAIEDGSFDELLYQHPITRDLFEKAHLETRTIFELDNPLLPPKTPLDQSELWYTP